MTTFGKKLMTSTFIAGLAAGMVATPASAQQKLPGYEGGESITITGDIQSINDGADEFMLSYGTNNSITVEMPGWDWGDKTQNLQTGETVSVTGEVDNGFFEDREIEADTVYVYDRYVFYTIGMDGQQTASNNNRSNNNRTQNMNSSPMNYTFSEAPEGTWITVSGEVENVDGREFTLNTGNNKISIDTMGMNYNPLDGSGYQQIENGDQVYITGEVDNMLFDEREIAANTIIQMNDDNYSNRTGNTASN